MTNIQVKGLIRFSYPADGGFSLKGEDPVAQAQRLYDPVRLEERFRLFEQITLPSIKIQEDKNFVIGVLVGDTLPQTYLRRLEDLIVDVPQLELLVLPRLQHFHSTVMAFRLLAPDTSISHILTVRLDDDDAIHRSTMGRLHTLGQLMLQRGGLETPCAIGFNRGYFLDFSQRNLRMAEMTERTPLGIGLGLLTGKDDKTNIFRRNHRAVPAWFDCFTECGKPMWIRTLHGSNDSESVLKNNADFIDLDAKADDIMRDYGVDLLTLRSAHLDRNES